MSSSPPSPPFLHRVWPALLFLLASLGVPATALALFTRFVTAHPWLALGIALLYEAGVFVLGFAGKVWQRLEGPLVERTADWFSHRVENTLSRYQRRYYRYLYYQHRDFDVKGLSTLGTYTLELNQVFVELRVDPSTPLRVSANPLQKIPGTLREGDHAIWDYLLSAPLRNQHLVVIGPPGSGKTTLLKYIALTLVSRRILLQRSRPARIPQKIPILLFLRDHVTSIKEQADFTLVDALHEHLRKWEQPLPPTDWVKRRLLRGRCLVMLDGLDEVAEAETRQAVVNWVERQMMAYPQNRFLVTSRPFGYRSNPLNGVAVLEVRPFTTAQVERFVHQWYLANEIMGKGKVDDGVRMRARAEARALLQRLHNTPALFDLTINPLLLTMITTVHRYGGELPGNRVALYAEICEVFLGKRQQARGQTLALTPAQIQLVLKPLAYHLMEKGVRDLPFAEVCAVIREPLARAKSRMKPEAFLQLVEQTSGLLLERENGVYSFAHLTFQEYLAAIYIKEKQWGHLLVGRVGESWWHETIRLYCALADATPILTACLAGEHSSAEALAFALDCEQEAPEVEPAVRATLERLLEEGMEENDAGRQHVVAAALLTRRLRAMMHLKDETYADTSLITCAEYQPFLDEQREQGNYLQPDHWTAYRFPSGAGNTPVLGVRQSDAEAFCHWLTAREPGWQYRLPAAGELQGGGIHEKLPANTGYWLMNDQGFAWAKKAMQLPDDVLQEIVGIDFDRALARDRDRAFDRTRDLALTRDLARARADALDRDLARARAYARARARILVRELALTFALSYGVGSYQGPISYWKGRAGKEFEAEIQRNIDGWLEVYIDLLILEKRIQGELPACEGILIVKERK